MTGAPIAELNAGLRQFAEDVKRDTLASLRVDLAVVAFGGDVQALNVATGGHTPVEFDATTAFVSADEFIAPELSAAGDTPMGEAVHRGLGLLRERKEYYRMIPLKYYRPWLVIMTDGQPTDHGWEAAAEECRQEEERNGVTVFPIGVEGANMEILARFAVTPPLRLKDLAGDRKAFQEFFKWLSGSISATAASRPNEQIALPPIAWSRITT
jgi:uncharacterized protein YegL